MKRITSDPKQCENQYNYSVEKFDNVDHQKSSNYASLLSLEKWAKDMTRHSHQVEMQMANKYTKRCSIVTYQVGKIKNVKQLPKKKAPTHKIQSLLDWT